MIMKIFEAAIFRAKAPTTSKLYFKIMQANMGCQKLMRHSLWQIFRH
ncbi:Hypothetical protein ACI5QL_02673 [Bacillus velezensis]